MPNGDEVWKAIDKLRDDHKNLSKEGCGLRRWHETTSDEIKSNLSRERSDREHMGEYILKEMKEMKEFLLSDNRAIRNQLLFGMLVLMALTLVIDKVLK